MKSTQKHNKVTSIRLPSDLDRMVEAEADTKHLSKSQVVISHIRNSIEHGKYVPEKPVTTTELLKIKTAEMGITETYTQDEFDIIYDYVKCTFISREALERMMRTRFNLIKT